MIKISLIEIAATTLAAIVVPQNTVAPVKWTAEPVALSEPVTEVRQTPEGVFAWAGGWYELRLCDEAPLCAEPGEPILPETPEDGIPGGTVATAEGDGIQRAWYAGPTDRYPHGALGDAIEASMLVAEDVYSTLYTVELGPFDVFEDLAPRIVDIDGDGQNEVITIRSSLRSGAAVAVYYLSGRRLIERTSTPPIGRANRWLNIAGIADFTGDGRLNIAIVKTPHEGGKLEILDWSRNELKILDTFDGFSDHVFGSPELGLSAVASVDGDRIPDLILPNEDRTSLRMVTAAGGKIRDIASVPLPAELITAIGVLPGPRPTFVAGLVDGELVAVSER
jgi:hypothetical protein